MGLKPPEIQPKKKLPGIPVALRAIQDPGSKVVTSAAGVQGSRAL